MSKENERIFDVDPDTGAVTKFIYDEAEDTVVLKRKEDVTRVLEMNKEDQNSGNVGWIDKEKSMRKVAEIPVGVQMLWFEKYGIMCWKRSHQPAVMRLLNSNEWQYLRTNNVILKV